MNSNDVADRLAIRELVERYTDALNVRDFEAMAALFTPDAIWSVGAPYNLRFEGEAIATSIAGMITDYPFFLQLTHSIVIDLDGDAASARTTVREVAKPADPASGLNAFGIYHDALTRSPAGWRFAARRFQPLYLDIAPLPGTVVGELGSK